MCINFLILIIMNEKTRLSSLFHITFIFCLMTTNLLFTVLHCFMFSFVHMFSSVLLRFKYSPNCLMQLQSEMAMETVSKRWCIRRD